MNRTDMGVGVLPVEMPTAEAPEGPPPVEMPTAEAPEGPPPVEMPSVNLGDMDVMGLIDAVKAGLRQEMAATVADVERRLTQAREIEHANATGVPRETIHAEDLNISRHLIDGYLLTANAPTAGSISWSSLHVVLLGVDYTITDGNTPNKYAWFVKPGTGTSATLMTGNTLPTLGPNDALIFVNNGGVPVSALETSISYAVGPGVIGNSQLAQDVQTVLSTLQANDIAQQSALDGAITTHYSNDPPWPSGAPSPLGGNVQMGDVWYDANDNGAFRWTGATPGTGITPNTWQRIADTDNSALANKLNTKTTTYLNASGTPPTAPTGGFTEGDLWMVTNMNNLMRRWSGSAWIDLQIGDAAIAGVSGAKIGSGINATNITTGTVNGTLVGTGINGTNITTGSVPGARIGAGVSPSTLTGTGTAPLNAIPTLGPGKLNTAFHMLY